MLLAEQIVLVVAALYVLLRVLRWLARDIAADRLFETTVPFDQDGTQAEVATADFEGQLRNRRVLTVVYDYDGDTVDVNHDGLPAYEALGLCKAAELLLLDEMSAAG